MSNLVSTTEYITVTDDLVGNIYTVAESLYLEILTLKATNNVANSVTDIGVIGTVQEDPDLSATGNAPPRMVIRLSVTDELLGAIKRTLNSSDL